MRGRGAISHFLPVTLALPLVGSALGIDGGAVFQIFASEELGMSATMIGLAFGLGVLSLPLQIWAARMPLWRARRNLRTFLAIAAAQAWVLAVLVAKGDATGVAAVALAVTVTAEISLSVLYATAWQPLMSFALTSVERQQINSRGSAAGGALLAASLLVFAALDQNLRVVFLVFVGVIAVGLAVSLRRIPAPDRPEPVGARDGPAEPRQPISAVMRRIYLAFALLALGAWPIFLVYVHTVLCPEANLGVVGALQLGGSLLARLAWRPTTESMMARARIAGIVLLLTGVVLAALRAPLDNRVGESAVLVAAAAAAAATTTIRLALLELAHRSTDDSSSVRAFTLLDVVGSSSMQLGFLAGGLLVTMSTNTPDWLVDPYRIYILACTGGALVAIGALRRQMSTPALA